MHRVIVVGLGEPAGALLGEVARVYTTDPMGLQDDSSEPLRLWFVPKELDQAQQSVAQNPMTVSLGLEPHDLEVMYYQHEQVRQWCGPNWRGWGIEALRTNRLYGKLAAYYHLDRIVQVLSAQMAQIQRAPHERLFIYIAAMLGDAFATGALMDIAYVLDQQARQRNGRVFGMLFLPPAPDLETTESQRQQQEWEQVIAYATLRELHFYSGPNVFYANQHRTYPIPTGLEHSLNSQGMSDAEAKQFLWNSPFQSGDCYLLGGVQNEFTNPISHQQALSTAAQWIYLKSVPQISDQLPYSSHRTGCITTFGLQMAADEYIGLDDAVVQLTALQSLATLVNAPPSTETISIPLQDLIQFEASDEARRHLQNALQRLPNERQLPTGRRTPAEHLETIDSLYRAGIDDLQTLVEPLLTNQVDAYILHQSSQLTERFQQAEHTVNTVRQLDDTYREALAQLRRHYEDTRQQRQAAEVEAAALVGGLSQARNACLYWLEGQSRTIGQLVGEVLVGGVLLFFLTLILIGVILFLGLPFPVLAVGAFVSLGMIVLFDSLTSLAVLSLLFVGTAGVLFASNSFIVQAVVWLASSALVYRFITQRLRQQRQNAYRLYIQTQREALERQFGLLVVQARALSLNALLQSAQQHLGGMQNGVYQRYSLRLINASEALIAQYSAVSLAGQPTLNADSLTPVYQGIVSTWQTMSTPSQTDQGTVLAHTMLTVKRSHILNQDMYDAALLEKAVLLLQKAAPHLLALNLAYLPEQNRYAARQFVVTKGWKEHLVVDEMHTFFQQQQMNLIVLSSPDEEDASLKRKIAVLRVHPMIPLRALLNLPLWRSVYVRWCESWRNQQLNRYHSFFHPMRVAVAGPDILLDPPPQLDEQPPLIWAYTFLMQRSAPIGIQEDLCSEHHIAMHPRINYDELCGALQQNIEFIHGLLHSIEEVPETALTPELLDDLRTKCTQSIPRLSEEFADWQVWTAYSLRMYLLNLDPTLPPQGWLLRLYAVIQQRSAARSGALEKDTPSP